MINTDYIGQINLEDYMAREYPRMTTMGCKNCICKHCLYWWSNRCPYGGCWDDHRAAVNPYDAAHPDEPPRTGWSNWDKPGEQAHWCRDGVFYPAYECSHYVRYEGCQIKDCLKAVVAVHQDGYIDCSIVDTIGCQQCYKEFIKKEG